ncbi:MAG TPA: hypothetical protein VGI93_03935 [Steroidobacteraceae bacterium]
MQISAISGVSSDILSSTPPSPLRTAAPRQAPAPTTGASASARPAGASNGAAAQLRDEIYATRVAGKNYFGDVTYASGIYTISVAGLPGADSSASSLFAAENALNARIDLLA